MPSSTKKYNWTEEQCLKLIREYKAKPLLWNPQSGNDYLNKSLKRLAWEDIGKNLGIPCDVCCRKMCTMLTEFRKEKEKALRCLEPTDDPTSTSVYKSQWFGFDEMTFLVNVIENEAHRQALKAHLNVKERDVTRLEESPEKIQPLVTMIGSKLNAYPKVTKNIVEHAILDILIKADRGDSTFDKNPRTELKEDSDEEPEPVLPAVDESSFVLDSKSGAIIQAEDSESDTDANKPIVLSDSDE